MSATFDGHLLHRLLQVDDALANGDYDAVWVDLEYQVTPEHAAMVRAAAQVYGVEVEDFVVACATYYIDHVLSSAS